VKETAELCSKKVMSNNSVKSDKRGDAGPSRKTSRGKPGYVLSPEEGSGALQIDFKLKTNGTSSIHNFQCLTVFTKVKKNRVKQNIFKAFRFVLGTGWYKSSVQIDVG
jgi:hypothetical protein